MTQRLQRLVLFLGAVVFAVPAAPAQEPVMPPPPRPMLPAPTEPEGVQQWLDEVRAQRRAREERRRAAKEARDARRRLIDPWGAAQMEARAEQHKRRRDAFREEIDRKREALRSQAPWATPPSRWPEAPKESTALESSTDSGTVPEPLEPEEPGNSRHPYLPLPGWDNRWYYRGY